MTATWLSRAAFSLATLVNDATVGGFLWGSGAAAQPASVDAGADAGTGTPPALVPQPNPKPGPSPGPHAPGPKMPTPSGAR